MPPRLALSVFHSQLSEMVQASLESSSPGISLMQSKETKRLISEPFAANAIHVTGVATFTDRRCTSGGAPLQHVEAANQSTHGSAMALPFGDF